MAVTTEDRATIRRMIVNSGYLPGTAACEMATRGHDYAAMLAVADEIAAEVCGQPRPAPLPRMSSALAARRAIFGAHEVAACASSNPKPAPTGCARNASKRAGTACR